MTPPRLITWTLEGGASMRLPRRITRAWAAGLSDARLRSVERFLGRMSGNNALEARRWSDRWAVAYMELERRKQAKRDARADRIVDRALRRAERVRR